MMMVNKPRPNKVFHDFYKTKLCPDINKVILEIYLLNLTTIHIL